jgi:uncharacterized YccA/Bax inhibitor family protein
MRTSNPALNDRVFQPDYGVTATMTLGSTVAKTAVLLLIALSTAGFSWEHAAGSGPYTRTMLVGGVLGGLVAAVITIFKPRAAPISAPVYAACKGLFLGVLSQMYEARFHGIVLQAGLLTFGTLGALLLAYSTRLIRATENFKLGVVAATGGIALVYLLSFVMGLFGMPIPFLHESGLIGIGFSVFVVVVAALNLVLDFDFIESGCERGAPKHMEWYAAFGLMVTLVWLYVEILRLLAKLSSRN